MRELSAATQGTLATVGAVYDVYNVYDRAVLASDCSNCTRRVRLKEIRTVKTVKDRACKGTADFVVRGHQPAFLSAPAATADMLADIALRSVGRLDVLFKYACGCLGRAPCLRGVSTVSRRQLVRNAG